MGTIPREGERYLVRKKFWSMTGASLRVFGEGGELVAFCRQKAFKLKEDIRIYTDPSKENELLTLKARSVIDFGATYDVSLPGGERVGSFRRKRLKSTFLRDEWIIFDEHEEQIALLRERGALAFLRHWNDMIALLVPQHFDVTIGESTMIASYRQSFNPLMLNLGVRIHGDDERLDDLMILAGACLLGTIEGRQRG